ncbi:MAG: nucleotidyltransferase family protein [Promethearchaeota archaeon]
MYKLFTYVYKCGGELNIKWIPRWIGKIYSKLWAEFKENTFYFDEVKESLGKLALNYLSELKRAQALFIFERKSRKRVYRLISPDLFAYSLAYKINLGWLKQGAYANLILKIFLSLKEKFGKNLLSLGIYGSVARNNAKKESDLDLFLIFQEITGNICERLDLLLEIENTKIIQEELKFLYKKKFYPTINFYPRKVSELRMSFFTIDTAFDMKIIWDSNVLNKFLTDINKKIKEQGITRKYLDKERYYLDLNIKFGEVFEFE